MNRQQINQKIRELLSGQALDEFNERFELLNRHSKLDEYEIATDLLWHFSDRVVFHRDFKFQPPEKQARAREVLDGLANCLFGVDMLVPALPGDHRVTSTIKLKSGRFKLRHQPHETF